MKIYDTPFGNTNNVTVSMNDVLHVFAYLLSVPCQPQCKSFYVGRAELCAPLHRKYKFCHWLCAFVLNLNNNIVIFPLKTKLVTQWVCSHQSYKKERKIDISRGIGTRLCLQSNSSHSLKVEREYRLHVAEAESQHWVLANNFGSETFTYS